MNGSFLICTIGETGEALERGRSIVGNEQLISVSLQENSGGYVCLMVYIHELACKVATSISL